MKKLNKATQNQLWIWGVHSVSAALNAGRSVHQLLYIAQKKDRFQSFGGRVCAASDIERVVPKGAVHQGVALLTESSRRITLEDLDPKRGTVLLLDQIVDPHNVGALWRSAAAFQAQAIIVLENRSAKICGVVTKTASGAVDHVPYIFVVNIARTLEQLKKKGFFCVGLCETGTCLDPKSAFHDIGVVLIIGQEGKGIRLLTRSHCDVLWKLNVCPDFPTLNASVAGAVALSQLYKG